LRTALRKRTWLGFAEKGSQVPPAGKILMVGAGVAGEAVVVTPGGGGTEGGEAPPGGGGTGGGGAPPGGGGAIEGGAVAGMMELAATLPTAVPQFAPVLRGRAVIYSTSNQRLESSSAAPMK
jgi:hypothetical protein